MSPSPSVTGMRTFASAGKSNTDGVAGELDAASELPPGVAPADAALVAGGFASPPPLPEHAAVNSKVSRAGAVAYRPMEGTPLGDARPGLSRGAQRNG
ncbi:hypothetical protein GCM10017668_34070 [Streptomyces tuirus]|uniref:Uncharacterized protein n=1 Tax=Streptomyces tuirus TaxID=68278 RepID=A0A7G1NIV8_9ACTN|nr:hypothetical protein GCM10017668_34070 [Streptomyces tuirus]